MPINLTPTPNTPTGVYTTIAAVRLEMGTFNEQQAADSDNAGDPNYITAHEQSALDFADSYINSELSKANFATPATVNLTLLGIVAAKLAAYQLYQVRGLADKANAFQMKFDWAKSQLEELLFMNRGGFTRATGYADAPLAVKATVNANGQTVQSLISVPFWNGYYWQW